jgi:hypothetical protein
MKQGLCVYWVPVGDAKLLPAHHSGSAGLAPLHPEAAGSVGEEIRTALLKHERKQTGSCWGAAWLAVLPFPTNNPTAAAAAAAAGLHIYIFICTLLLTCGALTTSKLHLPCKAYT